MVTSMPGENFGELVRYRVGLVMAGLILGALALPMMIGRIPIHGDIAFHYLPLRSYFATCMAEGNDPSWCPNLFGGFFLAGEGAGLGHPLVRLLYATLPLGIALNVELLTAYAALLAGFIALARRWGMRRDVALMGGIMFGLGGYNLTHFMHVNVLGTLAHFPWLLLAVDIAIRSDDRRQIAAARLALGFLTGSQILLAPVQFIWITGLGALLYAGFVVAQHPRRRGRLLGMALSTSLGVLIGAWQLLPIWDAFLASHRKEPSPSFVAMGSLPPWNLAQWVAPYLTVSGVITPPTTIDDHVLAPAPSMHDWRSSEFTVYYGACVPSLLIFLGLERRRLQRWAPLTAFGLVLAVISLLLAFGDFTPLFHLTTKLPIVGKFRVSARYLILFHFAVVLLCCVSFGLLSDDRAARPRRRLRELWPLALPPLASLLILAGPSLPESYWPSYLRDPYLSSLGARLAAPLLVFVATALVAASALGSRWTLIGLLVFASVDQAGQGFWVHMIDPPVKLSEFVSLRRVPDGVSSGRSYFDTVQETWLGPYTMKGVRLTQGYASLQPRRQLTYKHESSLRVAGVSWRFLGGGETADSWIPVPGALPRTRLVTHVQKSDSPELDLERVDVAKTALLEQDESLPGGDAGEARLVVDRPGKLDVMTSAATRQLLVVSESHHSGWRVLIDDHEQPLLRVNGDFFGCVVPKGRHHVKFRFRPASLIWGYWLSWLGALLTVVVSAYPLWIASRGKRSLSAPRGPRKVLASDAVKIPMSEELSW